MFRWVMLIINLVHMNFWFSSMSQIFDKEMFFAKEKIWNASIEETANGSILNGYLPNC